MNSEAATTRNSVSEDKPRPNLDEQAFEKLLEAAYVLQEHNRQLRAMEARLELQSEQLRQKDEAEAQAALLQSMQRPRAVPEQQEPAPDYTLTLAQIVEAQHQIQIRHLQADDALAVVAERVTRITGASGAGIAILEGKTIRYHAGFGPSALPVGDEISLEKAICAMCVRTGQVLRTPDVNTEFLFDPELCHPRHIESLVAVPVYHDGNIVGALELYFDVPKGFAEQDIHTCQLMAGLITEAIGRKAESALKKSMAEERSSMMAAIDRLRPSLQPLASESEAIGSQGASDLNTATVACPQCGNSLLSAEQFCGRCGTPLAGESEIDPSSLQSKAASAWRMPQSDQKVSPSAADADPSTERSEGIGARLNASDHELNLPEFVTGGNFDGDIPLMAAPSSFKEGEKTAASPAPESNAEDAEQDLAPSAVALAKADREDMAWTSAARARDFLEGLSGQKTPGALARFWQSRRGDFYLVIAVLFVAAVIRWGVFSSDPVGATGGTGATATSSQRKPAADANLSTWDKLLVGLGVAEAPETPEYKGNPDTQVWVDLHTALYYCPGSELYGKTPKGKFSSQRDAQLDQFESASRKVCD